MTEEPSEKRPAGQLPHELLPLDDWYLPGVQFVQPLAVEPEYLPAAHLLQVVAALPA